MVKAISSCGPVATVVLGKFFFSLSLAMHAFSLCRVFSLFKFSFATRYVFEIFVLVCAYFSPIIYYLLPPSYVNLITCKFLSQASPFALVLSLFSKHEEHPRKISLLAQKFISP